MVKRPFTRWRGQGRRSCYHVRLSAEPNLDRSTKWLAASQATKQLDTKVDTRVAVLLLPDNRARRQAIIIDFLCRIMMRMRRKSPSSGMYLEIRRSLVAHCIFPRAPAYFALDGCVSSLMSYVYKAGRLSTLIIVPFTPHTTLIS